MDLDEIIYAVGELYLKYRKQQQIAQELGQRASELEAKLSAALDDPIERVGDDDEIS